LRHFVNESASHRNKGTHTQGRFERSFDRFFAPIPGPALIPAATVIGAGADIARARPELAGRIAAEILKVGLLPDVSFVLLAA
jgi:hypothetical protein